MLAGRVVSGRDRNRQGAIACVRELVLRLMHRRSQHAVAIEFGYYRPQATRLEQEATLELRWTRQLIQVAIAFHLVDPLRHKAVAKRFAQDRNKPLLLRDFAVHLDGKDDGVGRREKSILGDSLKDLANRDLAGQGVTVRDGRLAIIAVPDVDCAKS